MKTPSHSRGSRPRYESSMHLRNAVLVALLALLVLAAGVDVRLPWEVRAPISLLLLVIALGLALHDPIHSVWVTHHPKLVHARAVRRIARPRVDRTRGSRPGWL